MGSLPNLIIAGPPKAGTTSVYEWLKAHPECTASYQKETHYFADRENQFNKQANFLRDGFDKYSSLFPETNSPIVFEASPVYIGAKTAKAALPKLSSCPKLLFIYREPSERIWSEYTFFKYTLHTFTGSLDEYLGWNGSEFSSRYFHLGKNVDMINDWIKMLGEERVFIFDFNVLKSSPGRFMKSMSATLNIDSSFYETFSFLKANESVRLKSKRMHQFGRTVKRILPGALSNVLGRHYKKLNQDKIPSKTEVETTILEKLKIAYKDQRADHLLKSIVSI